MLEEENRDRLYREREIEPKEQFLTYLKENRNICVLVCIHGKGPCGIYGEIADFCQKEPKEFSGARDVVQKIKGIYSGLNTQEGEADFSCYEWEDGKKCMAVDEERPKDSKDNLLEEEGWMLYPGIHGAKEILTVLVKGQVEENLWGVVRGRLTRNRYVAFHNDLELIQLLDKIEI